MTCPKCGTDCDRDEVDVGVGVITGPWGCSGCGWSDDPRYDFSDGKSPVKGDGMLDPQGGWTRTPFPPTDGGRTINANSQFYNE